MLPNFSEQEYYKVEYAFDFKKDPLGSLKRVYVHVQLLKSANIGLGRGVTGMPKFWQKVVLGRKNAFNIRESSIADKANQKDDKSYW